MIKNHKDEDTNAPRGLQAARAGRADSPSPAGAYQSVRNKGHKVLSYGQSTGFDMI